MTSNSEQELLLQPTKSSNDTQMEQKGQSSSEKASDDTQKKKQGQCSWKKCCSEFWYAIVCLPLCGEFNGKQYGGDHENKSSEDHENKSGEDHENKSGEDHVKVHENRSGLDVKYGAMVFFTTAIAICLGFLTATILTHDNTIDLFAVLFDLLLIFYFITQVTLFKKIITADVYDHESLNESRFICVKLIFFAVMSFGSCTHSAFNIVFQITCDQYTSFNDISYIVGFVLGLFFTVSQFFYLFVCLKRKTFFNTGISYFAFSFFILLNILNFAKHSIDFHFEDISDEIDIHDCKNRSSDIIAKYREHIKPIIDPMVFEVSVLAILLYGEVISRHENKSQNHPDKAAGHDGKVAFKKMHVFSVCCVILLSTLICFFMFLFKLLQVQAKGGYKLEIGMSYAFAKFILYGVLLLCFVLLRNKKRYNEVISLTLFDLLLFISALGSTIYFTLHFISSTYYSTDYMFIAKNILNIVTTYLQTVLILKIRYYKDIGYDKERLALPNCLLFCAMINLLLWIFDTFIEAQFVYKHLHTISVFGLETFLNIRHVLLPLIIYYRFKCFLGFLKCSNVLSFVRQIVEEQNVDEKQTP